MRNSFLPVSNQNTIKDIWIHVIRLTQRLQRVEITEIYFFSYLEDSFSRMEQSLDRVEQRNRKLTFSREKSPPGQEFLTSRVGI